MGPDPAVLEVLFWARGDFGVLMKAGDFSLLTTHHKKTLRLVVGASEVKNLNLRQVAFFVRTP